MYKTAKQRRISEEKKTSVIYFSFCTFFFSSSSLLLLIRLYKIRNFMPADSIYEAFESFIERLHNLTIKIKDNKFILTFSQTINDLYRCIHCVELIDGIKCEKLLCIYIYRCIVQYECRLILLARIIVETSFIKLNIVRSASDNQQKYIYIYRAI
jgi:hypothetical protein